MFNSLLPRRFRLRFPSELTLEIVCSVCGRVIYVGNELKSPRDVLKHSGGRCVHCGSQLSAKNFTLEVLRA